MSEHYHTKIVRKIFEYFDLHDPNKLNGSELFAPVVQMHESPNNKSIHKKNRRRRSHY